MFKSLLHTQLHFVTILIQLLVLGSLILGIAGCSDDPASNSKSMRLAVTTSTRDSGLLDQLIPKFEAESGIQVDVIAVGTGKAIRLGKAGEVDAIWVHAESDEIAFMNAGHGTRRESVMKNHFLILGPPADPAGIKSSTVLDSLRQIVSSNSPFVSRGDDSGTHKREMKLWERATVQPAGKYYLETGSGMAATLMVADQKRAYTLCDQGTFLKMKSKIELVRLSNEDKQLENPYSVIVVNSIKNELINDDCANRFADFLISESAQNTIQNYRVHGKQLFEASRLSANED